MLQDIDRPQNHKIQLAEVKRVIERLLGDSEARAKASLGINAQEELLQDLEISLSPEEIKPLWEGHHDFNQIFESDTIKKYPLLNTYREIHKGIVDDSKSFSALNLETTRDAFNSWRQRTFYRCGSETGTMNKTRVHPVIVYELSKGCSVGCWFCALAPGKFKGYFPYSAKNARFWKDILKIGQEMFGNAARNSALYHATEPFDNPDYFKFMDDFQEINGILPQTTTAVPFRDFNLTQEMLKRRNKSLDWRDRFSVLNLETLRRIHRDFSPLELEHVELVLQNKEALSIKANAGRARNKLKKHQYEIATVTKDKEASENNLLDPTTVECVHGFLVNLWEGTLKLISPCKANDQWLLGYRVHFESTFQDKHEYQDLLSKCIEKYMPQSPDPDMPLSFRSDLQYERFSNGFKLKSPFFEHEMKGKDIYPILGDAIESEDKTSGKIAVELNEKGFSYFTAISYIQLLFDRGLLADELDYKCL